MSEWCHEFDFTASKWGWEESGYGEWDDENHQGWLGTPVAGGQSINIIRYFSDAHFTFAQVETENNILGTSGFYAGFGLDGQAQGNQYIFGNYLQSGTYKPSVTLDVNGDVMVLNPWAVGGSTVSIKRLILHGTGANPFVPAYAAQPTGGGETIWTYRAPITGNPTKLISQYITTSMGVAISIDSYAIDPINRHLWLHSGDNWFKATATDRIDGTTLKPVRCFWVEDSDYAEDDRIIIPELDTTTFRITLEQILACISNGVANASYTLPQLENVPFEGGIPEFTRFPMSMEQVCQGDIEEIRGLGVPPEGYGVSRLHNGADIFAPAGSDVYSIADNGLVVGIGISLGLLDDTYSQRSANYWRAAAVEEGVGYCIIVRYRHLYVLFGHIMEYDPNIYVGKEVNIGTRLGEIGTYPDSYAHLHIEIRSFGSTPASDSLVKDETGANNPYGILANGGSPAPNIYDVFQFFDSNTQIAEIDTNQPSSQTLSVTGLDIDIDNETNVTFSGTPVNTLSCSLPAVRPYATQLAPEVGDYRGFVLGIYPNQAAADPTVVTQL
jgi:murein DD-endopeptidase MepM/ murein hydrolase activator NlpD